MEYEKSRKDFYAEKVVEMAEEIAMLLDNGYQVEICKSRTGLKVFYYAKNHHVRKGGFAND